MAIILMSFILSLFYSLLGGWFLMLAVGIIHHEWIPTCPTIGYGWAVLLAMCIRGALFVFSDNNN